MNFVRLIPVLLSAILLGAHFLRVGQVGLVLICGVLPLLLFLKRRWVGITFQLLLLVAAGVWVKTLWELIPLRQMMGQPWLRLVLIISAVALFTATSSLVFRLRALRLRFRSEGSKDYWMTLVFFTSAGLGVGAQQFGIADENLGRGAALVGWMLVLALVALACNLANGWLRAKPPSA